MVNFTIKKMGHTTTKETRAQRKERHKKSEKLFDAIGILNDLGERDLAFQLRIIHDTHFRRWK